MVFWCIFSSLEEYRPCSRFYCHSVHQKRKNRTRGAVGQTLFVQWPNRCGAVNVYLSIYDITRAAPWAPFVLFSLHYPDPDRRVQQVAGLDQVKILFFFILFYFESARLTLSGRRFEMLFYRLLAPEVRGCFLNWQTKMILRGQNRYLPTRVKQEEAQIEIFLHQKVEIKCCW